MNPQDATKFSWWKPVDRRVTSSKCHCQKSWMRHTYDIKSDQNFKISAHILWSDWIVIVIKILVTINLNGILGSSFRLIPGYKITAKIWWLAIEHRISGWLCKVRCKSGLSRSVKSALARHLSRGWWKWSTDTLDNQLRKTDKVACSIKTIIGNEMIIL